MLVAAGLVSAAQVEEALARQKKSGPRLGETLVAMGAVTEAQMTQVLSNQLSIPWVDLYHVDFSRELLDRVPADLAEQHRLIPVYVRNVRRQGDTLYVAMDDPLDLDALQQVADRSGLPVKPMVAAPTDIENAIRVYYLGLPPLPPAKPAKQQAKPARKVEPPVTQPSQPPPAKTGGSRFRTLTLLDGTQVRLPAAPEKKEEATEEQGLTARDLLAALAARAAGKDVSDVLEDGAWEPLFAALLSILMRKGLVADWEFVDEWKKHRTRE